MNIKEIINQRKSRPESSLSSSDKTYQLHGKPIDLNTFDAERFWKFEFVKSMKKVCPSFVIDDQNKALLNTLYKYAWRMETGTLNPTKGLLLWGGLGVGKSTLLKGLQDYEMKMNRYVYHSECPILGFHLTSATEIALRYAEKGVDAIVAYTSKRNLAIDEVGREPLAAKHYGTQANAIQLILQLRYEKRFEGNSHLTTNLDPDKEFDVYGNFVVDRIKDMFNVIRINGESRR
ncbi:hypothetical protein [Bacteroides sp. 224]|uniref:hypothetical protein n=1 Tax=Bacteroides sp. 224 TaxID=2302936 RepID=UPI0013D571B2|nr:hypothetical protein [Bacteroides sp. 224]NDV65041.1 hypothetical protein [Bacteroides sp. 224]